MAIWDFHKLQQHLSKSSLPSPSYFIFGQESFLIEKALKLLQSKTVSKDLEDFNVEKFDAQNASATEVKNAVMTLPMMASHRFVLFQNVHKLQNQDWEVLTSFIEKPMDSCVLVLVAEKVDQRKKYFKTLSRHCVCVELKTLYDRQIPMWIENMVAKKGLQINPGAKALLHQWVGSNLHEIQNEIFKLKSYMGHRSHICEDDIMKVVSRSRVHSIFELTHAIGERDASTALILLARLLQSGESEVAILILVLRHIRTLGMIQKAQSQGLNGAKLSSTVGIHPFFLKQYQQQSRLWSPSKIKSAIHLLHNTDRALKSSSINSHIWLENFIFQSCQNN